MKSKKKSSSPSHGANPATEKETRPVRGTRSWAYGNMNDDQDMNIDASEGGSLSRDYRDELRDILDAANDDTGVSRYRICKQMGIDSGTLSNVLAKRRHFSLDKLDQMLGLLGYRITFTPDK